MARSNRPAPRVPAPRTHEGAVAARITPYQELRRSVCACLLYEDSYYESGVSIADRIKALVAQVPAEHVIALAVEARENFKLRHVPLLLVRELARLRINVATVTERIIQRPDELTELLAIYWDDRTDKTKKKLPNSMLRGMARAFTKFSAYALAKYRQDDKEIKLRDALFLCHPKPKDDAQAATWKQLAEGTLPTPDTWEVELSASTDKLASWTRLLRENKLGALALLRNLRNMQQAKVDEAFVRVALTACKPDRVLPFRFISAAKHAPTFEPELEALMFRCLEGRPKLKGRTVLVVDGSGSMQGAKVSAKSELDRFDAAAALAMLVREVCEHAQVIVFSNNAIAVPPRRGFALVDAMKRVAEWGGTDTERAKQAADAIGYDRLIIITDEQSHTKLSAPEGNGYVINVASYQNGIGYGPWTHCDGWSESILDFIQAIEQEPTTETTTIEPTGELV